jgi:MFS superfamily sulfate permease-like transporter
MVETNGGSSQITHLTTAAVVAVVLLVLTGPLRYLPTCALGAIVFVVAVRLIDVSGLRKLRRSSPSEFILALLTTAAVVFLGVERGIILALVLSLLDHVRHGYQPHTAVVLRDPVEHWQMVPVAPGKAVEPGLVLYWFGADLYYANAPLFTEQARLLAAAGPPEVRWLVVDSGAITGVDYTAATALKQLRLDLARQGVVLAFTRVNDSFREDLDRMKLTAAIGAEHIFRSRKICVAAYLASQEPAKHSVPS